MSTKTLVKVEQSVTSTSTPTKKRKGKDEVLTILEDDGLEILQVTPSPKKRSKGKDDVTVLTVKKAGRPAEVYEKPYTILTMGREDCANVLAVIPGGYTDHYRCFRYIRILHGHLSKELHAWIDNVVSFINDMRRDAPKLYDLSRSSYIKGYVLRKIVPLLKLVEDTDRCEIVLHALNVTAIKAFFQCGDKEAKLIHYLGAAHEFQLKFKPVLEEEDGNSYEIYTLFSHGRSWNFGLE